MRNRTRLLLTLAVVLLAAGAAWLFQTVRSACEPSRTEGDRRPAPGAPPGAPGLAAAPKRPEAQVTPEMALLARMTDDSDSKEPIRHVAVVGRVVDKKRIPVEGASVRVLGERFVAATGKSDAHGRFRVEVSGRLDGSFSAVHISDGAKRAVMYHVSGRTSDDGEVLDVGTRELDAATSIAVRVTSEGVPATAAVLVWAETAPGGWSNGAPFGSAITDSAGRSTFAEFPLGWVGVFAQTSDGRVGRTSTRVSNADGEQVIEVELTPARTLEVTVVADDDSKPVSNASVRCERSVVMENSSNTGFLWWFSNVPRLPIAPTGPDGHTRIEGLTPAEQPKLSATADGFLPDEIHDDVYVKAEATSAEIRLKRPRVTTFAIRDGELPAPPAGTRLRAFLMAEDSDEIAGKVEEGKIVVRGRARSFAGIAIAPDGSIAPLLTDEWESAEGRPTTFAAPRRLVVRAVSADGTAVAGIPMELALPGGRYDQWLGSRPTGADGRIAFERLPPWVYLVRFGGAEHSGSERPLAQADLSKGDATVEVVVGGEVTIVARVLKEGKAAIPSGLTWSIEGGLVLSAEEEPAEGTLRIRARALSAEAKAGTLDVDGLGMVKTQAEFRWPPTGGTVTVEVGGDAEPEIFGEVRSRPGQPRFVDLEAWVPSETRWTRVDWFTWTTGDEQPGMPSSRPRRIDLPAGRFGRYRFADKFTGMVSDPFDVVPGGPRQDVVLDLTSLATIRGRVEVPAGADATDAKILVDGPGLDSSAASRGSSADTLGYSRDPDETGAFVVQAPLGKKCTLGAVHPSLVSAKEGGSVEVEAPRDGVVLRLVEGSRIRVHPLAADGGPLSEEAAKGASLFLRPVVDSNGYVKGHDLQRREGGAFVATGLPVGDFEAWLDVPPFASRRFPRVHVGDEVADLGTVRLEVGSALVVHLVVPKGSVVTNVGGEAALLGLTIPSRVAREFDRDAIERELVAVDGDAERWRAAGLCAGRWKVHVTWKGTDGTSQEADREVEATGHDDLTIEVPAK